MIQTINVYSFRDAFRAMGRANQFSYEGLGALFDYIEDVAPDSELDVIALCCECSEETVEEVAESYGLELPADETEEEHYSRVQAYLEAHTFVIAALPGRFLFAQF